MTESAIYRGPLYHERFSPTQHRFSYDIAMFWLKLSEVQDLQNQVKGFACDKFAWIRFKRSDYLGDNSIPLQEAVLKRMSELAGTSLNGDVFLFGQMRTLGMYFSPVNFYFLRDAKGEFTHMLAEVSNTPWNERHHYLVDVKSPNDTQKAFHVSPFNPMDMTYRWRITPPAQHFALAMDCHSGNKVFSAGFNLSRQPLNSENLSRVLRAIPSMTIKTMVGIYWHALKLWLKRTPIYDHPKHVGKNNNVSR